MQTLFGVGELSANVACHQAAEALSATTQELVRDIDLQYYT